MPKASEVLTRCTVERLEGNRRVDTLRLSSGCAIEVDHVLLGVGVRSETDWLADSGLANGNGVPVDHDGRTRIDGVLAAGDAAASFDPTLGHHVPGSHWEAAARQGARAARAMLGLAPGPPCLTSFWTDQYGIQIQYLGRARAHDSVTIEGEPATRRFTATFTRAGRPVAALLVDCPCSLPAFRSLIEKGSP